MHASKMVQRTITLALLLLSFVHVQAAPVPENSKVSLIRNSTFGFGLAANKSKTAGIFQSNRNTDENNENKPNERRPDFSLLENINSGIALAFSGGISFGVIKDNVLAGKNPFWRKK